MNKVEKYERELAALVKAIEEKYMKENAAKESPASASELKEEIERAMYNAIRGKHEGTETNQVGDDSIGAGQAKDRGKISDACDNDGINQKALKYIGISFIKSRKSDDKIHELAKKMLRAAEKENIEILTTLVDQTAGMDIDRTPIDRLVSEVENNLRIDVILVNKLTDISANADDLARFFNLMGEHGVVICSMQQPGLFPPKCFRPRD